MADIVNHDQLCVGVDRGPRPDIASNFRGSLRGRDILLLGVAERPDFVALDAAYRNVVNRLVVKDEACFTSLLNQLCDSVERHVDNAAERSHRRTLPQHSENLDALVERQLVHASNSH